MEPCRCFGQRMRRHCSHTPPVLTANGMLHSSHSVLKIDFWKIGTVGSGGGQRERERTEGEIYGVAAGASSHATSSPTRIVPPSSTSPKAPPPQSGNIR